MPLGQDATSKIAIKIRGRRVRFNQSINQSKHISIAPYVAANQRRKLKMG